MNDAARQTQLSQKTSELMGGLERLDKVTSVLTERLTPVRCSRPSPSTPKQEGTVKEALAPLANFISDAAAHVQVITDRLECVLRELEC